MLLRLVGCLRMPISVVFSMALAMRGGKLWHLPRRFWAKSWRLWLNLPQNSEVTAYHGTTEHNATTIMSEGFRPSSQGMLGKGVYMSRDVAKALNYGGSAGVVVEVRARVGKVCRVDAQNHPMQKNWSTYFQTAWVPAACGMVPSNLEEFCVFDANRVRPVRIISRSNFEEYWRRQARIPSDVPLAVLMLPIAGAGCFCIIAIRGILSMCRKGVMSCTALGSRGLRAALFSCMCHAKWSIIKAAVMFIEGIVAAKCLSCCRQIFGSCVQAAEMIAAHWRCMGLRKPKRKPKRCSVPPSSLATIAEQGFAGQKFASSLAESAITMSTPLRRKYKRA